MAIEPTLANEALAQLALLGLLGALGALLMRRLRQPSVVGFLAAGLVAGPVLGVVRHDAVLEALGELGIALLLFLVGLDLTVEEARAVGPPALVVGVLQLLVSGAGGYVVALALGFDAGAALFLAVALSFSSTVVVVKILMDLGGLHELHGRLAVGVLLVQDAAVVLVLTLLPVVGSGAGLAQAGELAVAAGWALGAVAVLAGLAFGASRTLLPPMFGFASRQPPFLLLLGLVWLFAAVGAAAVLGVSVEVGAFLAGISLAPLRYAGELRRRVRPLLELFIALFFVSLAAGLDAGSILGLLPVALALSLFVLVSKPLILAPLLGLMGYPKGASLRTGMDLAQISEFGIVFAALALQQGLVEEATRDVVVLVAMMTIAGSSALIWRAEPLCEMLGRGRMLRWLPEGDREAPEPEPQRREHVLVLGYGAMAPAIVRLLRDRGEEVVVVDAREDLRDRLPEGTEAVYGDPADPEVPLAEGATDARLVMVDTADVTPALALRALSAPPPVVAHADTQAEAEELRRAGAFVLHAPSLVAAEAARRLEEAEPNG